MKYTITIEVCGYLVAEVEANSIEEAKELAEDEYCKADFGQLDSISMEFIDATDEFGSKKQLSK